MRAPAATLHTTIRRALDSGASSFGTYDRRTRSFTETSTRHVLCRAAATAEALLEAGLVGQQPVLVAATAPELLWRGYLATVLAGGLPALLPIRPSFDSRTETQRKLSLADRLMPGSALLLQATGGAPCLDPGDRSWLPLAAGEEGPVGDPDRLLGRLQADETTPLHLQLTSGSTGDGKPVVVTHGNVTSNLGTLVELTGLGPRSHVVCWLPLYHDLGLAASALTSLVAGSHLRLLSPFDFLADPANWLIAIDQCPEAVSAAPTFALDQVARRMDPERTRGLDLSRWVACWTGAEPVDSATVSRFLGRVVPLGFRTEALRPGYGLAESTVMVSLPPAGRGPRALSVRTVSMGPDNPVEVVSTLELDRLTPPPEPGCTWVTGLGPPAPCLTMELVDSTGDAVTGEEVCGEVVVSGPSVSPGYRRADGTIEPFPGGRCPTGDLGFLHQGELYLVERLKNVIIRHGQNHSASAYEQLLARAAGVPLDRCAVVQASLSEGRVVAVVESDRRTVGSRLLDAVRRISTELDGPIDEILLVGRNAIPRTTSGKKQHSLLRLGLRDGTVEVLDRIQVRTGIDDGSVIDLDRNDAAGRVLALVDAHARRAGWSGSVLTGRTRLQADLGFDSLALIELAVELEASFEGSFPEQQLGQVETVDDVVRLALASPGAGGDGSVTQALDRLVREIPQTYRRVASQQGRRLLIDDRWVVDLASVNYLGLDLHPDVARAIGPLVTRWGVHPSWTRAVASPAPYEELEQSLARMIGAPDVLVFSTISLAHIGLLPLLATRSDTLVVDRSAHRSIQEAAELAASRGTSVRWFRHGQLSTLEAALRAASGRPIVAVDGVYSMSGSVADLPVICQMTAEHGGLVYIDDAHGFGVLGAGPDERDPYGRGGGGVGTYLGLEADNIVYVAGLSKAFSSLAAFVSCRSPEQRQLFERASTSIFSGPVPVASLATALAGLAVNEREGDELRRHLHRLTTRVIAGARARGYEVGNALSLPIVNLVTGDVTRTVRASKVMWEHGILFTPSVYPAAPLDRGGFRVSLTAANTDDDVDRLFDALDAVERAVGHPPPAASSAELSRHA